MDKLSETQKILFIKTFVIFSSKVGYTGKYILPYILIAVIKTPVLD